MPVNRRVLNVRNIGPIILIRTLAILWTALTLAVHSIPRFQLERIPGGDLIVQSSGADKIAHAVLFSILGLLWSLGFPRRPWTVLAVGVAYGVVLEIYQGWLIPGRTSSQVDALFDALGMMLGTLTVARYWPERPGRS
jgi:hypothetical protein